MERIVVDYSFAIAITIVRIGLAFSRVFSIKLNRIDISCTIVPESANEIRIQRSKLWLIDNYLEREVKFAIVCEVLLLRLNYNVQSLLNLLLSKQVVDYSTNLLSG